MAVRYEYIWAVVVDGKKVGGWFDRQTAIIDAKRLGGHAKRLLVECALVDGASILPDWFFGR